LSPGAACAAPADAPTIINAAAMMLAVLFISCSYIEAMG
jgi:hypothetical protein